MTTDDVDDCFACSLATGRTPLPGGRIHETTHWLVEPCIGPLGAATMIVKPRRHVTAVAELTDGEAAELGPLLRNASKVAAGLVAAEQVYNCLWSHAGGEPGHLHYVIQPATADEMARFRAHGPFLQTAMFDRGEPASLQEIEAAAEAARAAFTALQN